MTHSWIPGCCFWLFPYSRSPLLCPHHKVLSPHSPTQGPHLLVPFLGSPRPPALLCHSQGPCSGPTAGHGPSPPEPALQFPVLPSPPCGPGMYPVQTPLHPVPEPFPPTPNWASSPLAHPCHPQTGPAPSPVPIHPPLRTERGQAPLPRYQTGSIPAFPAQTPPCGAALPRASSRSPPFHNPELRPSTAGCIPHPSQGWSARPGATPAPDPGLFPRTTGCSPHSREASPPPQHRLCPCSSRGFLPLNPGCSPPEARLPAPSTRAACPL